MKYKVGDEVLVKARIIEANNTKTIPYTIIREKSTGSTFNCMRVKESDIVQNPDMTAEEAWEIAKKILLYPAYGGLNSTELEEIFGETEHLWELTPQEAKAKIEAWKEQKEIKVGDVVKVDSKNALVMRIDGGEECIMLFENGDSWCIRMNALKKTGRHIDIEGLLKQIGGNE